MIDYPEQLGGAIRATRVTSPTSYKWLGTRSRPLSRRVSAALPPGVARRYLIDGLETELYRSFYSQGRPVPATSAVVDRAFRDPEFVAALSAANTGRGGWAPAWRVETRTEGAGVVTRNGLSLRARVSDWQLTGDRCEVGSLVSLRRPKGRWSRRLARVLHRAWQYLAGGWRRRHRAADLLQSVARGSGPAGRHVHAPPQRSRRPVQSEGGGPPGGLLQMRYGGVVPGGRRVRPGSRVSGRGRLDV